MTAKRLTIGTTLSDAGKELALREIVDFLNQLAQDLEILRNDIATLQGGNNGT